MPSLQKIKHFGKANHNQTTAKMGLPVITHTNGIHKKVNSYGYPEKTMNEIVTNGFFIVDHKWTVKYWNKAAEKLLKVDSKDILGKNIWEEFAGILPLNFYVNYHKAFLQNVPVYFEEYWEELGAWFEVITWHTDDTLSFSFKSSSYPAQPVKQEEQFRVLNELYRFVTEVTNDCIWEWNLQTKEVFWIDGGHKRVFGYPIENTLIPQSFWESLVHPDDRAGVLSRLNKIISDGAVSEWEDEYRFRRADGDYAFVHDRGHIIYKNGKPTRMIGATQDITSKVLLENTIVHERNAKQKEITGAVLTAQEKERADIGMELHDNLGQILAVAKMYIQMAKAQGKNREMYIEKSCTYIENVIHEIRRISKDLVIPGTHIIGLFDNIKNLLENLEAIHPVKIKFSEEGVNENELSDKLQVTIFRIVQEQVNNILNHAYAKHATIHIGRHEGGIQLLIADDGQGCDLAKEKKGVGLVNIKSRAELYDGSITIVSKPGEGFQLSVVLPLNAKDTNNPDLPVVMPQ